MNIQTLNQYTSKSYKPWTSSHNELTNIEPVHIMSLQTLNQYTLRSYKCWTSTH